MQSSRQELDLKQQLQSVQEAAQEQLAKVSGQLEANNAMYEKKEKKMATLRTSLENEVASARMELEASKDEMKNSDTRLNEVCVGV